jgi:hypothetical protein
MPYRYRIDQASEHVHAAIEGDGNVDEFISAIRQIGAESVNWTSSRLLVDLRGVETVFTFTEQLRIGQAVGVNLRHLKKHAAIVKPERITRVGEKAAQHQGGVVQVFDTESQALEWLWE